MTAGKEVDRVRARSAPDVIRQHPVMVLYAVSPVIAAAVLVGWLTHPVWGVLLLILATIVGGRAVVRRR